MKAEERRKFTKEERRILIRLIEQIWDNTNKKDLLDRRGLENISETLLNTEEYGLEIVNY